MMITFSNYLEDLEYLEEERRDKTGELNDEAAFAKIWNHVTHPMNVKYFKKLIYNNKDKENGYKKLHNVLDNHIDKVKNNNYTSNYPLTIRHNNKDIFAEHLSYNEAHNNEFHGKEKKIGPREFISKYYDNYHNQLKKSAASFVKAIQQNDDLRSHIQPHHHAFTTSGMIVGKVTDLWKNRHYAIKPNEQYDPNQPQLQPPMVKDERPTSNTSKTDIIIKDFSGRDLPEAHKPERPVPGYYKIGLDGLQNDLFKVNPGYISEVPTRARISHKKDHQAQLFSNGLAETRSLFHHGVDEMERNNINRNVTNSMRKSIDKLFEPKDKNTPLSHHELNKRFSRLMPTELSENEPEKDEDENTFSDNYHSWWSRVVGECLSGRGKFGDTVTRNKTTVTHTKKGKPRYTTESITLPHDAVAEHLTVSEGPEMGTSKIEDYKKELAKKVTPIFRKGSSGTYVGHAENPIVLTVSDRTRKTK